MSATRPEDMIAGLLALALVPLIALRIVRGLREGRLPIYRTYHERAQSRSKFAILLVLHTLTLLIMLVVAADLLLGLGLRERL
jgi:hypothetical protein